MPDLVLSITADNGRQLISSEFKDFCVTNNIALISTMPYWPQMNGEVERQNRSILKRLSISQEAKRDWKEDLQEYLLMYRSTPHSVTLKSPAELMFNRKIRDKLPSMQQAIEPDSDKIMKEKGKEYADAKRHAKISDIKEGDEVLIKRQIISNKLATMFEPTVYKVVKRNGPDVAVKNTQTSTQYRRNIAHIKKFMSHEAAGVGTPIQAQDNISRKRKHSDAVDLQKKALPRYPKRKTAVPRRYKNF